jgi:hypothetical protein
MCNPIMMATPPAAPPPARRPSWSPTDSRLEDRREAPDEYARMIAHLFSRTELPFYSGYGLAAGGAESLLDEVVRDGARQMLAAALHAEVAAYIE